MKSFVSFAMVVCSSFTILMFTPKDSIAECSLSHEECHYVYECIEKYPNGTCKKTKKTKECETVCDDYDVDLGGVDDANQDFPTPEKTDSEAASYEKKN